MVENRIIQGEIDSVGGVFHLPLHWVSIIFNIQEWSILYGDSLGEPLPKSVRLAFTKWIQHLKHRSKQNMDDNPVPIHLLSTGYQDNTVSCGIFALNALDHYYLEYPLLSPDQVSVAIARMNIALCLLQANMVCIFYMCTMLKLTKYYRQLMQREILLLQTSPSSLLHPLLHPLLHSLPYPLLSNPKAF